MRRLVTPLADGTNYVEIVNPEEKGSDVNLATYLVYDAAIGACDKAIVVTNDADLAEPIHVVAQKLGRDVSLLHPMPSPSGTLVAAGPTDVQRLRVSTVLQSQFSATMSDADGSFRKPASW